MTYFWLENDKNHQVFSAGASGARERIVLALELRPGAHFLRRVVLAAGEWILTRDFDRLMSPNMA